MWSAGCFAIYLLGVYAIAAAISVPAFAARLCGPIKGFITRHLRNGIAAEADGYSRAVTVF
jgi:hypothetical protein